MRTVAAVVLGGWIIATGAALACTSDADCDNGDTCSIADTCVSGSCVAGGGGDTDVPPGTRDFVCDGELDPNLDVVVNKLVIRKRTSPAGDNSSARGKGSILTPSSSAAGAFTADEGVAIRVKDALSDIAPDNDGIDVTFTFAAEDCTTNLPKITCISANRKSFARFKQNPFAPNQWGFFFKLKGLGNLTGPFFGPVRVVFTRGGDRHRSVLITDCALTVPGLKCREF
jgi:hypothetical protein